MRRGTDWFQEEWKYLRSAGGKTGSDGEGHHQHEGGGHRHHANLPHWPGGLKERWGQRWGRGLGQSVCPQWWRHKWWGWQSMVTRMRDEDEDDWLGARNDEDEGGEGGDAKHHEDLVPQPAQLTQTGVLPVQHCHYLSFPQLCFHFLTYDPLYMVAFLMCSQTCQECPCWRTPVQSSGRRTSETGCVQTT